MAHTIKATQLNPNQFVYVRGNVTFSRLTRFLTDEQLKADNAKRQMRGLSPVNGNYLTITVDNARVIPRNPGQLSLEENYIAETFYKSQKNPQANTYTVISKSAEFPKFYEPMVNPDGSYNTTQANELPISGEPATGLDVTIVLRSFKPKMYNNVGFVIHSIIANEKMKYYDFSSAVDDFKKRGMIVNELSPEEREAAIAKLQNRTASTPVVEQNYDDVVETAPVGVIPPANNVDPYSTIGNTQQAMNPPVQAQPNQTQATTNYNPNNIAAPVNNTETWSCPACGASGNTGRFCNNCGTQKPEVNQTVSGITYDPNSTNRNY